MDKSTVAKLLWAGIIVFGVVIFWYYGRKKD